MEERLADRLIQVGLRTINDEHRNQFKRFGVEIVEAGRFAQPPSLNLQTPLYVSIDIDALDPAYAPGVSHREPGGLSTRQVIDWIHRIDQRIVAADIVEYNPRCDISNMTATVAAKLAKEVAGMMMKLSKTPEHEYLSGAGISRVVRISKILRRTTILKEWRGD